MNNTSQFIQSFINATLMFILTFMVFHINNQLLTAFIAKDFELQPTLFFSQVDFFPGLMSSGLTQDARIALVMAVPAVSLLLALAGQFIYLLSGFRQAWVVYFFLWWMVHGYNRFFGLFLLSPFMGSNHHLITGLLALSLPVKLLLAASAFLLMYKIGDNISRAVLAKTGYLIVKEPKERIKHLAASILGPWILSSTMFWWIAGEGIPLFRLHFVTLSVMLIPAIIRSIKPSPPEVKKQVLNYKISWVMIVFTIFLTAGYFWLTHDGFKV